MVPMHVAIATDTNNPASSQDSAGSNIGLRQNQIPMIGKKIARANKRFALNASGAKP
jgi:hypothetical protein